MFPRPRTIAHGSGPSRGAQTSASGSHQSQATASLRGPHIGLIGYDSSFHAVPLKECGSYACARLNVKDAVGNRWLLRLKERNGDVMDWNSACCAAIQPSVVSVSVHHQIGAMPIDYFRQT